MILIWGIASGLPGGYEDERHLLQQRSHDDEHFLGCG